MCMGPFCAQAMNKRSCGLLSTPSASGHSPASYPRHVGERRDLDAGGGAIRDVRSDHVPSLAPSPLNRSADGDAPLHPAATFAVRHAGRRGALRSGLHSARPDGQPCVLRPADHASEPPPIVRVKGDVELLHQRQRPSERLELLQPYLYKAVMR